MRNFQKTADKIANAKLTLEKECAEFIQNVLKAWGGDGFDFSAIQRVLNYDDAYVTVVYDGGRHPEYNSNAFSEVELVHLNNEKSIIQFDTEDEEDCDIVRFDVDGIYAVADAMVDCINVLTERFAKFVGGGFRNLGRHFSVPRSTWDNMVAIADGKKKFSDFYDGDDIKEVEECLNPNGIVALIKEASNNVKEDRVIWLW